MAIPGRVRCVYHFGSDALKAMILKEKQFTGKEIQYGDLMSFLRDNGDTVQLDDKITSVFGLENICCKSIILPLGLIPSLNTLSKPLHTDRVAIMAEHGYKLGYVLNNLFPNLDFCSRHQMTLKYAIKLLDQCDGLLGSLVNSKVCENCDVLKRHDALEGVMDTQTFQLCLQEVLLIAGICLKYMWQCGMNTEEQVLSRKIDRLACGYMDKHFVPDYLQPKNSKNLSEQHRKYKEQGKVFGRAINIIKSKTKGLLEIIWDMNQDSHVVMKITQSLKDDSV